MRVAVSAQGDTLDAPASPVFGRCPFYVFVDSETMSFEAKPNEAMNMGGGAGIQAAQFVVQQGAQAVLSGNLGPNAYEVLQAAGVPSYLITEGTVRQAVEAFKEGQVQSMAGPNVAAHAGAGQGMGMGMGRGIGRGRGRRMGGGGRGLGRGVDVAPPPAPGTPPDSESQLSELRENLKALRRQLADTMDRIEKLEKGE
jgi:predicted Fe-Mo cluster-binding NifX family protein